MRDIMPCHKVQFSNAF